MHHDPRPFLPKAIPDRFRGDGGALSAAMGDGQWSPDLVLPPSLWELFVPSDEVSGDGLALAFGEKLGGLNDGRRWLWVQDGESIRRSGRPYLHGLPRPLRSGLVHVAARTAADALWAMEEGVRCGALHFVIGELAGDPKSLDFTASRRLVLAAERHGVPLLLLRREGHANLSAARLRWRVAAAPGEAHRWNPRAPGAPRIAAELFRARALRPQGFTLALGGGDEREGHRLHLAADLRDRPVEPDLRLAG